MTTEEARLRAALNAGLITQGQLDNALAMQERGELTSTPTASTSIRNFEEQRQLDVAAAKLILEERHGDDFPPEMLSRLTDEDLIKAAGMAVVEDDISALHRLGAGELS
jgi:hypothetical protein